MVFIRTFVNRFLLALLAHFGGLGLVEISPDHVLAPVVNRMIGLVVVLIILDSVMMAAGMAANEYKDTKQKQELEALGLYCSNCAHLKHKMFGRLICGLTGQKTTESDACVNHSDYAGRRYKPAMSAVSAEARRIPPV